MDYSLLGTVVAAIVGGATIYFLRRQTRVAERTREDNEIRALDEARKAAQPASARYPVISPPGLAPARKVVGRDTELDLVSVTIGAGRDVAVTGGGGVGKSTLAREFADARRGRFHGIWWIAAETPETLVESLYELAVATGTVQDAQAERRAVAKAVLARVVGSGEPWLLVYDNAPGFAAVREWLPDGGKVRVIVTTRPDDPWPGRFQALPLDRLPFAREEDAAVDVLMAGAERRGDRAGARALSEALGGLPLSLVVAGAWLRDAQATSFADYLARMEAVLEHPPPADYADTLLRAVKLSYDALDADARAILNLFAHLAPEGLEARLISDLPSSRWFTRVRNQIPAQILALAGDAAALDAALGQLRRRSLLQQTTGGKFILHRMTSAAVRRLQGRRRQEQAAAAAAALATLYPHEIENFQSWPDCFRLAPHVAALFDQGDVPITDAMGRLLNQAAIHLDEQAEHERAINFARTALQIVAQVLPEGDEGIAVAHTTLGSVLLAGGQTVEAERELADGMRLSSSLAADPRKVAAVRNNHGTALEALGRQSEAARRFQQSLAHSVATLGRSHENVSAVSNLARLRNAMGQRAMALALAGKALRIRRASLPEGDPRIARSLNNLGFYLLRYGAADQAEPLLEEALAIKRAAYGREDHPDVVNSVRWLATCLLVRAAAGEDWSGREERVHQLAARYGFDAEDLRRDAAALPYRPGMDPLDGYVYRPPADRAAYLPSNFFRDER